MAVAALTRFSGGTRDAVIARAKQAKVFHEKAGAELFRLGQVHTGPWVGQWLVTIRWPDWATYGNAQQALASDAAYQRLLADTFAMMKLESRSVVTGLDL